MPFKDIEKRKEYRRKWYANNKESEKAYIKKRKLKLKKWFQKYKEKLSCSNCGENHPSTIEFHHRFNDKEKNVSLMVNDGYSVSKIMKEVRKCDILCANCHRKVHYNPQKP